MCAPVSVISYVVWKPHRLSVNNQESWRLCRLCGAFKSYHTCFFVAGETRAPRGNPRQRGENMQTPPRNVVPQPGIKPRTFLLWGDSANHLSTLSPTKGKARKGKYTHNAHWTSAQVRKGWTLMHHLTSVLGDPNLLLCGLYCLFMSVEWKLFYSWICLLHHLQCFIVISV